MDILLSFFLVLSSLGHHDKEKRDERTGRRVISVTLLLTRQVSEMASWRYKVTTEGISPTNKLTNEQSE